MNGSDVQLCDVRVMVAHEDDRRRKRSRVLARGASLASNLRMRRPVKYVVA